MTGLEFAVLGTEAGKAVVSEITKRALDLSTAVPPDQRPGFAALQPLVIASSQTVVTVSAEVLDMLEPFQTRDDFANQSVLERSCRELAARSSEMKRLAEKVAPKLAGMRRASRHAVPQLEPFTAEALDSAVRWHGWTTGVLLDFAIEAERTGLAEPEASSVPPIPPELLAQLFLSAICWGHAVTAHRDLQQTASQAAMSAVGADGRAFRKAQRRVSQREAGGRELWAWALERFAETLDDVVSPPTIGTRLKRRARRAWRP